MKLLRLHVIYPEKDYSDDLDISPQTVYERFPGEIPHTSTPSPQEVKDMADELKREGYTHVLAFAISSGLSGTYNLSLIHISRIFLTLAGFVQTFSATISLETTVFLWFKNTKACTPTANSPVILLFLFHCFISPVDDSSKIINLRISHLYQLVGRLFASPARPAVYLSLIHISPPRASGMNRLLALARFS